MPPLQKRCSVHHGPDHKRKPNWQCPRPAVNGSDLCRVHGGKQPAYALPEPDAPETRRPSSPRTRPEATMPADVEHPTFCSYRPVPGELLHTACVECGHALALHIGVEHCPVCELVQHNRQVRAAMAANRVEVHVTGVDQRVLERTLREMNLRELARGGRYRR